VELLRTLLSRTLGLGGDKPEPVLDELSLRGVSRFLKSDRCKNVVCMVGAGISTCERSFYDLPYPEAIFEIGFFKKRPEPFFALARELYPGQFKPTVCHYFMRLLQDKGLLLRCYTQNIDTLERVAGLDPELLVEAHGTFFTSHCLRPSCRRRYGLAWMRGRGGSGEPPGAPRIPGTPSERPRGHPDPSRHGAATACRTGLRPPPPPVLGTPGWSREPPRGFGDLPPGFGDPRKRDVAWLGDCDDGCLALAELLGWKEELEELVRRGHAAIDA
ncbi:SIR2 deacetylase, partial [Oriolus oriolus]|nr:SIR2 deacetylase [Oriolus oriolus]